jgi:hypothetical protein
VCPGVGLNSIKNINNIVPLAPVRTQTSTPRYFSMQLGNYTDWATLVAKYITPINKSLFGY